jgi:hypothetical protein
LNAENGVGLSGVDLAEGLDLHVAVLDRHDGRAADHDPSWMIGTFPERIQPDVDLMPAVSEAIIVMDQSLAMR